jgi:hypothetical protein
MINLLMLMASVPHYHYQIHMAAHLSRTEALRRAQHKCGHVFTADIPKGYWSVTLEKGDWYVARVPAPGNPACLERSVTVERVTGHVSECGPCVRTD